MKKYIVVKAYKESISSGNVAFLTNSKEDATTYAELMQRNNDDGYTYHVFETPAAE